MFVQIWYKRKKKSGVVTGYVGNKPFSLISQIRDNHGRLLVPEVNIDFVILILIKIYNTNIESEQLSTFIQLNDMLINTKNINNKK